MKSKKLVIKYDLNKDAVMQIYYQAVERIQSILDVMGSQETGQRVLLKFSRHDQYSQNEKWFIDVPLLWFHNGATDHPKSLIDRRRGCVVF